MKRKIRRLIKAIFVVFCWFLPIKRSKIVVSSYYGKGYSDNIKYIVDKLIDNEHLKIIWIIENDEDKKTLPDVVIPCKNFSFMHVYHLATAGIWIDNSRKFFHYKKKNQLYIQTWHGGGGQKRVEQDVEDKLLPNDVKISKKDAKYTDLMISESRFLTDLYLRAFWYNGPVWECGYPRYDILLSDHSDIINKVYNYYHIDKNKRIVLYAPTFRQNNSIEVYDLDFENTKNNLEKKFDCEVVFLVRLHPSMSNIQTHIEYDEKSIINATLYPDAQELLCAASILIGDYSSINYDFAIMKKPVFRYATDIQEYMDDRDFYYSFEEIPYPYAENNNDLQTIINNFDMNKYISNLNCFFDKLGLVLNKNSSQEIADFINEYIKFNGSKKQFLENNSDKFIYKEYYK